MSRDCAMNAHQAYQCRRTADTDTAAGSATLIYAASIMKGPPARVAVAVREVTGGVRVATVALHGSRMPQVTVDFAS